MAELTVSTEAVLRNYRRFAKGGQVIPVLKDNACGLGMERIMALLQTEGVRLFACSTPEEALRLRGHGADILLLSCVHDPDIMRKLAEQQVILAVESLAQAKALASFGMDIRIHLAVDTGFGRFGFLPCELPDIKAVFSLNHLQICGIFSHFRSEHSAADQFSVFSQVLEALADFDVGLRHIAATHTAPDPRYQLDAVRVGTGLTGRCAGLEPAARLTGRICTIRRLPKGSRIGYNSMLLRRDTDVAIIDIGTADGAFLRRCCGLRTLLPLIRKRVSVGRHEARVLGTPGLTHTAIDVTGIACSVGDSIEISQTPALVSPSVPRRYT